MAILIDLFYQGGRVPGRGLPFGQEPLPGVQASSKIGMVIVLPNFIC